jgi:hypothetical protein
VPSGSGEVRRIVVTELRDSTFYARIEVELHAARCASTRARARRHHAHRRLLATPSEIPADEGALEIDLPRAPRDSRESPSL